MEKNKKHRKESEAAEDQAISVSVYFIRLLFAVYFIVLTAERIQSIVRSVQDPTVFLFGDGFNRYTYLITFLSLAVSLIYLIVSNGNFFAGIFTRSAQVHGRVRMGRLCAAAGLILVSGMVHTEYTVAPIQFGAYGALIVAIIIQTVLTQQRSDKRALRWLSVAFLTAFSMAIPVMYRSDIANAGLFHVLEAITALVLVAMFGGMLYKVFCGDATDLFYVTPMLTALVLDTVLIVMRWQEEINWFVLISLVATCVLFCIGRLCRRSLLMIVALAANTVFMSVRSLQLFRKSILLTSSMILLYDVFIFSIGGIFNEALSIVSSVVGIIRYLKRDLMNQNPEDKTEV